MAKKNGDVIPSLTAPVHINASTEAEKPYSYSYYLLGEDEAPEQLADILNCSVTNLMVWNDVGFDELGNQKQIKVYESLPDNFKKREGVLVESIPSLVIADVVSMGK